MAKPIWLLIWSRLPSDFGRCETSMEPFRVCPPGLVSRRSRGGGGANEASSLEVVLSLSLSLELTKSQVNAAAINGV
jgi:hypothetical protein